MTKTYTEIGNKEVNISSASDVGFGLIIVFGMAILILWMSSIMHN